MLIHRLQPAFRHEYLRGYVAVMRQEITAAMGNWPDGGVIDLVEEMFTLTTTIALRSLFSSQLAADQAADDADAHVIGG